MCDACDYAMGAVLGQRTEKMFKVITMPAKPSMNLKRTTLQLKKICCQWCLLVKNSGLTYWDSML